MLTACRPEERLPHRHEAGSIPSTLSAVQFASALRAFSEPEGTFSLPNFTSNERDVGEARAALRTRAVTGGVYIGVGPEQNFSYIAVLRPAIAFIVDIRQQALIQHLIFKALFEISPDRVTFLSRLFSRPYQHSHDATEIQNVLSAISELAPDAGLRGSTRNQILENVEGYGVSLTQEDRRVLDETLLVFARLGPEIAVRGTRPSPEVPTFSELAAIGFLESEADYLFVKAMHHANLIVPVRGDFAGGRALPAIGQWMREHKTWLNAFYVSNVEHYLFIEKKEDLFYANLETIPLDGCAVFIRPASLRFVNFRGTPRMLCPIEPFLRGRLIRKPTPNSVLACLGGAG